MANDIPSPAAANIEGFRTAVRVHKCEALHCPYCLIRDWVNEIEEKLSQITDDAASSLCSRVIEVESIQQIKDFEDGQTAQAKQQYKQQIADFNRKLTADFDSEISTS